MDILERLAQVGEGIEQVENDLHKHRRLLTCFWRHLRLANHVCDGTENKGPREEATETCLWWLGTIPMVGVWKTTMIEVMMTDFEKDCDPSLLIMDHTSFIRDGKRQTV